MTTKRQTSTGTTLSVAKAPAARKVNGDRFRTPEAQEMFRQRWNTATERLAR